LIRNDVTKLVRPPLPLFHGICYVCGHPMSARSEVALLEHDDAHANTVHADLPRLQRPA
jgi:hypothetical protein